MMTLVGLIPNFKRQKGSSPRSVQKTFHQEGFLYLRYFIKKIELSTFRAKNNS